MQAQVTWIGAVLSALLLLQQATAEDHFLTIGGGYSPTGNQVSLEKNVQLFQKILGEQYPQGVPHELFFSDGDDPGRDLQFHDPQQQPPLPYLLLARIFRSTRYLGYQYRSHQLQGVSGASNRVNLQRWFERTGSKLNADDRLFVYVTAHGGRSSDRKDPHNTGLYLWNGERYQMKEMVGLLDKIPSEVPVVLVMVQCYAGGFANVIFEQGDAKKGASRANRCGFFATVHTRPAAGCTPDIHEANYQEYSSFFWEAIRGRNRGGQAIPSCDFNGDGAVSLAEAHAHALLASSSIDISVKTSDAFLRAFSRTTGTGRTENKGQPASPLLTVNSPYGELMRRGGTADCAVLEGLSQQLGLNGENRAEEARKAASRITQDKKKVESDLRRKNSELTNVAKSIRTRVLARWPELNNRWDPAVDRVLQQEGEQLVRMIETHPRYAEFEKIREQVKALGKQKLDLDRDWAKTQRLLHALENLALLGNLPRVANDDTIQRYQRLVENEEQKFFVKK